MFGGIPNSEIDDLKSYWEALPSLRDALFVQQGNTPYSLLKPDNLAEAIAGNADVKAFGNSFASAFNGFEDELHRRLITDITTVNDLKTQDAIASNIFDRLEPLKLIDRYAAYQALAERWQAIVNDIEILKTEGMDAAKVVEQAYKIKKDNDGNETEVPDGFKGRIMPFELVQATLLTDELNALNRLRDEQEEQESILASLLEGLDPEEQEKLLNDDNTKFDKAKVKEAWAEVLADVSTPEMEMLDEYLTLSKQEKLDFVAKHPSKCWQHMEASANGTFAKKEITKEKQALALAFEFEEDSTENKIKQYMVAKDKSDALDKQIKTATTSLTEHTIDTIQNLDAAQIEQLLHQKWITPVVTAIAAIPNAVLEQLSNAVSALQAKYAVTFSEIEAGIRESEDSLTELIGQLTGDAYALQGLNEFVKAGKE